MANTQIDQLISKFVAQLETVVRSAAMNAVQASLGAFGGGAGQSPAAKVAKRRGRPPKSAVAAAAPPAAAKPAKAPAPKKSGKMGRRSPAEIEATTHKILAYIKANPDSRSEAIKKALGIGKPEWLLPIQRLIETKQVSMKGHKRAATYSAGGGGTRPSTPPKAKASGAVPPVRRAAKNG